MPPPIVRKLVLLILNVFIDLLNSLTHLSYINGSHIPASLILLAHSGFSGSWTICCISHYPRLGTDVCFIFKSCVYVYASVCMCPRRSEVLDPFEAGVHVCMCMPVYACAHGGQRCWISLKPEFTCRCKLPDVKTELESSARRPDALFFGPIN